MLIITSEQLVNVLEKLPQQLYLLITMMLLESLSLLIQLFSNHHYLLGQLNTFSLRIEMQAMLLQQPSQHRVHVFSLIIIMEVILDIQEDMV